MIYKEALVKLKKNTQLFLYSKNYSNWVGRESIIGMINTKKRNLSPWVFTCKGGKFKFLWAASPKYTIDILIKFNDWKIGTVKEFFSNNIIPPNYVEVVSNEGKL